MAWKSAVSRLLRPVRTTLIIACVLQGISAVAGIAPFIAVVEIARVLLADEGSTAAITIAIVAAGALALRFVCMMAAGAMTHLADADLQLLIRRDIAARLRRVPLSWFTTQTGGALKKAIQDDVNALHEIVGHTFVNLTAALVTPLTALAYLGWVDPLLIPVALILPVAGLTPYFLQMRGYGDKMTAFDAAQAEVNAAAVEYVQGIGVIKTFSGPDRAFSRFVERSEAFVTYFWNWIKDLLALATATDLILSPFAAIVAAGGLGLWLASVGWISPVAALALVVMTPALTAPFLALGFAQNAMMQAKDAAKRIDALLDTPVLSAPSVPQEPQGARVVFEGVDATYDRQRQVLKGIDLVLEPGNKTAFVGPSGSGKSTLAKLMPRFLDPSVGRVTLGGVALPDIAPDRLYETVGFVFQDVRLLRRSVHDNIALGSPNASDAEIEAAARAAHIHACIARLPCRYETVLGDGTTLSGGEAQRLTIARALLADPPILVLDEALAFSDAETGAALRQALAGWAGTRTLLIVAHDLSTVVQADQICVMEAGRIAERGTHAALLGQGGLYAALWQAGLGESAA